MIRRQIGLATRSICGVQKVAILSGAGSVRLTEKGKKHYGVIEESTWAVFYRALSRLHYYAPDEINRICDINRDRNARYRDFRILYFKAKSVLQSFVRSVVDGKPTSTSVPKFLAFLPELRKELAIEFSLADCENFIELRKETLESILNLIPCLGSNFVHSNITTNWDGALMAQYQKQNPSSNFEPPLHKIHGSFEDNNSLYLPLDNVFEEELLRLLLDCVRSQKIESNDLIEACTKLIRPCDSHEELRRVHGNIFRILIEVDLIIVWGLGFNDDDIELMSIVDSCLEDFRKQKRWPKFVLADPSRDTRNRLADLFQLRKENRFDFDPKNGSFFEVFDERNI